MPSVKNLIVLLTAIILHSLTASGVGMALTPLDPGGNLSNFKVNTVVKSSDGYVWAGTLSGLSRHDSYSSTPYYINGSDMAPVGDNDVDGIWEDSTGRLWLKSHNMWHIYNPLTDLIEHNPDSILSAAGVKGYPTAIGTDRAGGMWVATDAGKIFHLAAGENSTAREVDLGNFPSLKGKKITGACDSREGMVFVTDRGELYCVSHGSAKVRWHDGSIARSIPEGDTMVFSIMLDREGLGWIYNTEQLWLYNSHTRSWANDRLPASGLGMVVKAIVEDDNGRVLIGRDHHGLELADKSARDIVFRQVDSGLPEDATVTSLFNDANGELWVGTYKHGVFMAGSEAREFSIVDTPDVNCMLERPDGKVWIGTDSRGLMLWDPASGNLSSIPDTSEKGEPSAITALYAAPGGQLLVGRFSRGLSELADGRMHKVVTSSPLDGTYAWGFAPAPAGKIWVATLTAGLFLYDPATGEARQWSTANSTLPSNCVVTVTTGTDGSVYAGTDSRQPSPANPDIPVALVVDDNSDMLDFLREGLSSDFRVITAADGESALKILSTIRPAIILTDIMMPGMNGMELCRRIKTNRALAGVPVVALSARNEEQAKVEMLTIGADDYLTKPFNTELLALRMKRLVKLTSPATSSRPLINPEPGEIVITSLDEKMVEKATKYVVANMKRTDLSVEELSAHMGMSRVHFYKRLKSVTGKTPVEFIRLLRLKRSAQLLRESQLNVSEVAYQVGFNNPKYFARYFADEFGMLPSVYKDQNGQTTLHTL